MQSISVKKKDTVFTGDFWNNPFYQLKPIQ
jgi:hypothetical protein